MADLKEEILKAYELVDRQQKDAALKLVNEILATMAPPNRVDIPPGRETAYDWLLIARKSLQGEEHVIVPPKAALRTAASLAG